MRTGRSAAWLETRPTAWRPGFRGAAVACLVAVVGCAAVGAQVAGAHRGMFVGTGTFVSSLARPVSAIGHLDTANRFTLATTAATGPWSLWGTIAHATTDIDNVSVLAIARDGYAGTTQRPLRRGLYRIDPSIPGGAATLWSGAASTPFPAGLAGLALDGNGDLVGISATLSQALRWERATGTWTGTTLSALAPNPGTGGLVWDKIDGGFAFANGALPGAQALYRLSADRLRVTTVATTGSTLVAAALGGALLEDGTWVSSDATGAFEYHVVPAGASTWSTGSATTGLGSISVRAERFSAPGRGYYIARSELRLGRFINTVAYADATTTPHTVTNLVVPAPLPNGVDALLTTAHPMHDADLVTTRTGKATWQLRLAPDPTGPTFANRSYVVLACLTPVDRNAPIVVPGRRELFFRFDALARLTLSGQAAPFVRDNIGVLDASGRGAATIDLTLLGTVANGLVVHFAGFVVDPAAPGGIGWVLEPCALPIDVIP